MAAQMMEKPLFSKTNDNKITRSKSPVAKMAALQDMYMLLKGQQYKKKTKAKKFLNFAVKDSPDNETRRQMEFRMKGYDGSDDEVITAQEVMKLMNQNQDNA